MIIRSFKPVSYKSVCLTLEPEKETPSTSANFKSNQFVPNSSNEFPSAEKDSFVLATELAAAGENVNTSNVSHDSADNNAGNILIKYHQPTMSLMMHQGLPLKL